jgi:hypothetical protein
MRATPDLIRGERRMVEAASLHQHRICGRPPPPPPAVPLRRALRGGGVFYPSRYFFLMAAPIVYLGSTKLPSLTMPHWLSIM